MFQEVLYQECTYKILISHFWKKFFGVCSEKGEWSCICNWNVSSLNSIILHKTYTAVILCSRC